MGWRIIVSELHLRPRKRNHSPIPSHAIQPDISNERMNPRIHPSAKLRCKMDLFDCGNERCASKTLASSEALDSRKTCTSYVNRHHFHAFKQTAKNMLRSIAFPSSTAQEKLEHAALGFGTPPMKMAKKCLLGIQKKWGLLFKVPLKPSLGTCLNKLLTKSTRSPFASKYNQRFASLCHLCYPWIAFFIFYPHHHDFRTRMGYIVSSFRPRG